MFEREGLGLTHSSGLSGLRNICYCWREKFTSEEMTHFIGWHKKEACSQLSFSQIKGSCGRWENDCKTEHCQQPLLFLLSCLFSHKRNESIRTIVQRTGQPPRRRAFASHLFFSRLRCFSLARWVALDRSLAAVREYEPVLLSPFFLGGAKTWHDRQMENEPTWSLDPDTNYNRAGDVIFLLLTLSRQRSYW